MLRNIFLVFVLIYSVCGVHWEIAKVDSEEDQTESISVDSAMKQKQPGRCRICKTIVRDVLSKKTYKSSREQIRQWLYDACNDNPPTIEQCRSFVDDKADLLVSEILRYDDFLRICIDVGACDYIVKLLSFLES